MERAAEREIRSYGLTPPQFDVLAALGNTEGLPLSEIGKKTLVTAGNITGIVDRLEAGGWVERKRCTQDRRIVYAALTPAGDALFQKIFPMQVQWSDRVLCRGLTPEERDTLTLELRHLAALFQQEADQPEGDPPLQPQEPHHEHV
ncbi:MAG: hypothetical protein AUJ55_12735 [Proteobacteria bacterium CG1_02_64_396]|nr:MAG: hypothetical protein AUJ55_12735 [Proteobacteria bacterium CG1_02_64_396]